MIKRGSVLAPVVEFTPTFWEPKTKQDWSKQINEMCAHKGRNKQILDMVEGFVKEGRQVLVLSDRVQHCVDMAEQTADRGISSATLVGKMTKKQREDVLYLSDKEKSKRCSLQQWLMRGWIYRDLIR